MVQGRKNVFGCVANFSRGKKCIFCGSFKVNHTRRGYVRCRKKSCGKQKSLNQLKRELNILKGFYQMQPAYKLSHDLGLDYQTATRVYQNLREAIYHITELEGRKLSGEIELDESYFGGRRRDREEEERRVKALFSACWSAMGGSTRGWWRESRLRN